MKEETREGESRVEKKWTLHSGAAQIFCRRMRKCAVVVGLQRDVEIRTLKALESRIKHKENVEQLYKMRELKKLMK